MFSSSLKGAWRTFKGSSFETGLLQTSHILKYKSHIYGHKDTHTWTIALLEDQYAVNQPISSWLYKNRIKTLAADFDAPWGLPRIGQYSNCLLGSLDGIVCTPAHFCSIRPQPLNRTQSTPTRPLFYRNAPHRNSLIADCELLIWHYDLQCIVKLSDLLADCVLLTANLSDTHS